MRSLPFAILVSDTVEVIFGLQKICEDLGVGSPLVVEVTLSNRRG